MSLFLAAEFPPTLPELFEFPPFLFEDSTYFAFNRTAMLYLLAAVIVIALVLTAFREPKVVPGRLQAAVESLIDVVRNNIILDVIGPRGLRYLPLLASLFLFILVNNLFEIAPFVNYPPTGRMALPAFLALMTWTVFILVGVKHHGLKYFKFALIPSGVPWPVLILIIPIELVSKFVVRPLTLAVRLFANMMAGHILLGVAFVATNTLLIDFHTITSPQLAPSGAPLMLAGVLTFAGSVALVAFELLVAALQAYIFTMLTAVYIEDSMAGEH